jgi:hypothetical protein
MLWRQTEWWKKWHENEDDERERMLMVAGTALHAGAF